MKKIVLAVCAIAFALPSLARPGGHGGGHSIARNGHSTGGAHHAGKQATGTGAKTQREHVSGFTKKNGTRVASHDRSTKDGTKKNNWSTKGNVNLDTGKPGTK
ncbi:MAG TPA: hypothetical protein VFG03_19745 [Telluria sp.]|nr:hypothetical protein [Telluria sp.]